MVKAFSVKVLWDGHAWQWRRRPCWGWWSWPRLCSPPPALGQSNSPPDAVGSITLTRSGTTLTVSWNAVSGADKYHALYQADGGGDWLPPVPDYQNLTATSFSFNIDSGKSYVVGVRAGNANGWGAWTDSPVSNPPLPAAVGSITLTRSDTTLSVSWNAVSDATKYHALYQADGGGDWLPPISDYKNITATGFTFSVDNDKSYVVGVRGGNSAGWGPWTDSPASGPYTPPTPTPTPTTEPTPTPTPTPAPQPPAAPAGLTATAGDGSVALAWDDPGDSSITGYEYNVNHNATGSGNFSGWTPWTAIPDSGPDTTSHIFNGLTNGREYRYHLRAVNGDGPSAGAPNAPPWFASAVPAPLTLAISDVTGTAATIAISNHSGAWHYQANVQQSGGGASAASDDGDGGTCVGPVQGAQTTITGLDPNSPYTINAYANPNGCDGGASAQEQFTTLQGSPPAAPSSVTPRRTGEGFRGKGTLTATWPAVTGATKYHINYTADAGRTWKQVAADHTTNSITFEIWNGYTYTVSVRAGNANGWSGWTKSPTIYPIPKPLPPHIMPRPDWVYIDTRIGDGTLTARWAPVTGAIKYEIRYSTDPRGFYYHLVSDNYVPEDPKNPTITFPADNTKDYTVAVRAGSSDNYYSFGLPIYSPRSYHYPPYLWPSSVTSASAQLSINWHTGDWYYKQTYPTTGTCSSAVSTRSTQLSNLTANTVYGFTAYSDSNCTEVLAGEWYFSTTDQALFNLGWDDDSTSVGNVSGNDVKIAAAFTSGNAGIGYTLTSIAIPFDAKQGSPGNIVVALHAADANDSNNPAATAQATLSGANPDRNGRYLYTYTCSTDCDLSKSTKYFVVISATSANEGHYKPRISGKDYNYQQPWGNGWSFAWEARSKSGSADWGALPNGKVMTMYIAANQKPMLWASNVTATTATLSIANHTGAWWYERTAGTPADTTCHSVASGTTTANLSSLTANTSYTYKAYDQSGCNSADEIATVTFTTPSS